jgi:sugar/nucleoside kinase (ribokinase family)
MRRVVLMGEVLIDIVMTVPALPDLGGDVIATGSTVAVGGGFNVMAAVARQGVPISYAGGHGTGPWGELARSAMRTAGIESLQSPVKELDTGFCVVLVDDSGERTFVTTFGAEVVVRAEDLAVVPVGPADLVYVSGYSLAYPGNAPVLGSWVAGLPPTVEVLVDPGPLVAEIPVDALELVEARADWWSCNEREAQILTGEKDPTLAASMLAQQAGGRGVLVRTGPDGAVLVERGSEPIRIPAPHVTAVDTNGAGDAHAGVFLAARALGLDAVAAARRASVAAALAVTRRGPATAPSAEEIDTFLTDDQAKSETRP